MSLYLVAGQGAATDATRVGEHLPTARPRRYPSDTTDTEWQIIAGYLPVGGCATSRGGRPVVYPRRDIVDAIRYLDHNGCVWRALPADFPPWPTVYHYFRIWTRDGTLARLHNSLREQIRVAEGRTPEPTAAVVDSQSLRAAETVAKADRGYDAGKNVNGRKRHIAVDTTGLLLVVLVTAASVQDRDAARLLLSALRLGFPGIAKVWADGGYSGRLVDWATAALGLAVDVVRKLAGQTGFQVLPRRWVVERTFSWINRCRRTVRDYERLPDHHAAMVQWAMITVMTRRLARYQATGRLPSQ
jgi:putative transposase